MSKRLAITISGAVSLGSYEAGVLYEIVHAIGQHNTDPATPPDDKIYIDVLTGASAGGMTATITAQKLLFEADALAGAYSNSFYLPWVADVSLDGLLAMHGDDDATKSILSSQLVVDLSKRYLTQRYQSHIDAPRQRHPACADQVRLGLALANLNGVDYGLALRPSGQFVYTRHQDELVAQFNPADPTDDTLDYWDPIRNAAVSCGAFAFAFRVVDVIRHATEYADPDLVTPIAPTQSFAYTDGGTFQNEPLGLAKRLVDQIDNHLDVDNRFYLFVAPGAKSSSANSTFNAGNANYTKTAERLVSAVFSQSRFQDWIMAEQLNEQISLFNQRAYGLRDMLNNGGDACAQKLQAAANEILPMLFKAPAAGQPPAETLEAARARLKKQFAGDYAALAPARRDAWIDAILTLETAAHLASRDEMTIYGITASEQELASFELFAFAGFFDRRYRDHDYDVGR
ncbi:MAG TPA: patatin-like phospholipase family protein, partial [Verrucomicrobiae bacterium]|nr:patatin-like phospholipase family protein [Verrucomicrobiae bacterium]